MRQNHNVIVLDIETRPLPALWEDPQELAAYRERVRVRSRHWDQARRDHVHGDIAETARDLALEEKRSKAALSPCTGKIVAIGAGMLDDQEDPAVWHGDDEAAVIRGFADWCNGAEGSNGAPWLSGFRIRDFDIPFLTFRAAACGVDLPDWWHRFTRAGQLDLVADVWDLAGSELGRLDDVLFALGLPRKTAMGEDSLSMELGELAEYCRNDVHVERELVRRLRRNWWV